MFQDYSDIILDYILNSFISTTIISWGYSLLREKIQCTEGDIKVVCAGQHKRALGISFIEIKSVTYI